MSLLPSDGIVPFSSVESIGTSSKPGHANNCHTDLLDDEEYKMAREVLPNKTR